MFRRCPASLAPTLRRPWQRRVTTLLRAACSVGLLAIGPLIVACGQKGPLMRPAQTAGPSGGPSTASPSSTAAPAAPLPAASSVIR